MPAKKVRRWLGRRDGCTLLFFLGSFPYSGAEPCRACTARAVRFVVFRHAAICVLQLCDAHAEQAESTFDLSPTFRSFDKPLRDGELDANEQNYVHALRGGGRNAWQ